MGANRPKKGKIIVWGFFMLLILIILLYPFYGRSLSTKFGSPLLLMLGNLFSSIGQVLIILGCLMLTWGLFTVICTRSTKGVKLMVQGVIIAAFGALLINFDIFSLFGSFNNWFSKGYH